MHTLALVVLPLYWGQQHMLQRYDMACSAPVSLPIDLKTLQKAKLKHILEQPSPTGMNLEAC